MSVKWVIDEYKRIKELLKVIEIESVVKDIESYLNSFVQIGNNYKLSNSLKLFTKNYKDIIAFRVYYINEMAIFEFWVIDLSEHADTHINNDYYYNIVYVKHHTFIYKNYKIAYDNICSFLIINPIEKTNNFDVISESLHEIDKIRKEYFFHFDCPEERLQKININRLNNNSSKADTLALFDLLKSYANSELEKIPEYERETAFKKFSL